MEKEERIKKPGKRERDEEDRPRKNRKEEIDNDEEESRRERKRRRREEDKGKRSKTKKKTRHKERKRRKRYSSSDESNSSDEDKKEKKVVNKRLLAKLEARGETLEERNQRRAEKRASHIQAKFGYTPEENPFNDPNLHEKFTWKKKEEKSSASVSCKKAKNTTEFYDEIEKVRKRREERELQREEMERIRAEENRMKELENYDEWAKKEELFHLEQQRQRSAIRLVEGREKPIDVLAKNLLLFGLSDEEQDVRASVKYQERYNAMDALASLDAELEEPHTLLKKLKLSELEELRTEIEAFRTLEKEVSRSKESTVLQYWNALASVVDDEIKFLSSGGSDGSHRRMVEEIEKIFKGKTVPDLVQMKNEVSRKIVEGSKVVDFDASYWRSVSEQLDVYLAKTTLSEVHSKMLVRQLEKLEERREELSKRPELVDDTKASAVEKAETAKNPAPDVDGGDLEEELGLSSEVTLAPKTYGWQDKYAPRRPRYFNRVKTGYDWNKYNQTHYDRDNPPPKVVQGYKFNIFYPDLIDPTKTPQFTLEPADTEEFCIIRFRAGAPYEDVAFKIVNREWNRRRKKGFKCTFERGVLSLYFNFTTHWYRR